MKSISGIKDRQFSIKYDYKENQYGFIPAEYLSKILMACQDIFDEIGAAILERYPSLPGKSKIIKQECKLLVMKANKGSLLNLELMVIPKEPTIIREPDLGKMSIDDFGKLMKGIKENSHEIIHGILPELESRKNVIERIPKLFISENHEISFYFPRETISNISLPSKENLNKFIGDIKETEKLEERISETIIKAKCTAKFDKKGKPKSITILDYKLSEEEYESPYKTSKISWHERTFILKQEITCNVNKEDHFVVIEYEPLRIRAYALNRHDAIKNFQEEFALLWDEFVNVDIHLLGESAKYARNHLEDLVKEIQ